MIWFAVDTETRVQSPLSLTIFLFIIYLSGHFFHLHASGRAGNGKAPLHAMYLWTFLLLAQGLFGFENFHICFSSFVLLHSDARANLKPNHDDGFGISRFEPSHITKSECGSGKIVWRSPLRGHHLFSPDSHLFNLFTAVTMYSLENPLEIGALYFAPGWKSRCRYP